MNIDLKSFLLEDAKVYSGCASIGKCYRKHIYFRYVFWLRLLKYYKNTSVSKYTLGVVAKLFLNHYEYKLGIHTDSNITIGKGLHIVHGGGVYLNAEIIGEYFTVYQGVTLGNNQDKSVPIIGDNVTIYTGAVVIGSVLLGNGCSVGANSVVTHNVAPKVTVVGIPAHILENK